jgi:hypothetical protein
MKNLKDILSEGLFDNDKVEKTSKQLDSIRKFKKLASNVKSKQDKDAFIKAKYTVDYDIFKFFEKGKLKGYDVVDYMKQTQLPFYIYPDFDEHAYKWNYGNRPDSGWYQEHVQKFYDEIINSASSDRLSVESTNSFFHWFWDDDTEFIVRNKIPNTAKSQKITNLLQKITFLS